MSNSTYYSELMKLTRFRKLSMFVEMMKIILGEIGLLTRAPDCRRKGKEFGTELVLGSLEN